MRSADSAGLIVLNINLKLQAFLKFNHLKVMELISIKWKQGLQCKYLHTKTPANLIMLCN